MLFKPNIAAVLGIFISPKYTVAVNILQIESVELMN